jgi:hypothetical protein
VTATADVHPDWLADVAMCLAFAVGAAVSYLDYY